MTYVTIKAHDSGSFQGYIAGLDETTSKPGIVLIQEIFGINYVMRDLAEHYAKQGYIVLCPDLFWRQEPRVDITDRSEAEWEKAFALYNGFDGDLGVEDLKSTLQHLRDLPGCNGKVGSIGFCLGGQLAYLMATRSNSDANVSYYGVGIDQKLVESNNITNPLLMHVATEDKFVPQEAQALIAENLASNDQVTIHRYEGNDHAFARHESDHYDADAAALAETRTLEFLNHHLG